MRQGYCIHQLLTFPGAVQRQQQKLWKNEFPDHIGEVISKQILAQMCCFTPTQVAASWIQL